MSARPAGSNADEWHLFLREHGPEFCAVQIAEAIETRDIALNAILTEPHGCVFCDSGKMRNPAKDHDEKCGFALARRITTGNCQDG